MGDIFLHMALTGLVAGKRCRLCDSGTLGIKIWKGESKRSGGIATQ